MVHASESGIAHAARVDIETAKRALVTFETADADSRTPDNEGKRVEKVEGGYLVLNYRNYRQLRNKSEQRNANRLRVARWRARNKAVECNAPVTDVTLGNAIAYAEAYADTDVHTETSTLLADSKCTSLAAPQKREPVPYLDIEKRWNEFAQEYHLPTVFGLAHSKRKDKVAVRWGEWHDHDMASAWGTFEELLELIPKSRFLMGKTGGRPWRVSFDWLVVNDNNWRKVLQGNYK